MHGIVFFRTLDLAGLREFYLDRIGCQLWLDQGDVLIFRHGNLLVGFCQRESAETQGMLTFWYDTPEEVDRKYRELATIATTAPASNPRYRIYQFFAVDPEGRALEFQYFEHAVPPLG